MEGIVFRVFDTMLTKNNKGVSSYLFVLCLKFSAFVLRASSALRNFLVALDFPQLLDALMKEIGISY